MGLKLWLLLCAIALIGAAVVYGIAAGLVVTGMVSP